MILCCSGCFNFEEQIARHTLTYWIFPNHGANPKIGSNDFWIGRRMPNLPIFLAIRVIAWNTRITISESYRMGCNFNKLMLWQIVKIDICLVFQSLAPDDQLLNIYLKISFLTLARALSSDKYSSNLKPVIAASRGSCRKINNTIIVSYFVKPNGIGIVMISWHSGFSLCADYSISFPPRCEIVIAA